MLPYIMQLCRIFDKKEDYQKLLEISSKNLYFAIAQKAAKYITPQNNKSPINLRWNILGNDLDFYYGNNNVNLVVGGKRYTGTGANIKALESALYNLFQGELKGEVELSRPSSRTMLSDRNEFNKATGTCFIKLYKSVSKDAEGKRNSEVLGSRSNAYALTKRQYENASTVPSFKKNNFIKVQVGDIEFYRNIYTEFINFNNAVFHDDSEDTTVNLSLESFYNVLVSQYKYLGLWSRTDEFYQLYENIESYLVTAVLYKDHVWLVIPQKSYYQVANLI